MPAYGDVCQRGGIPLVVKNAITARRLNNRSSHSSISTGTEPEFWTAVLSSLRMAEERNHVTAWNHLYPVLINLLNNKKYYKAGKTFQPVLVH